MDFNKKNINFKNIVKKNDFYDIENNWKWIKNYWFLL